MSNDSNHMDKASIIINSFSELPDDVKNRFSDLPWEQPDNLYHTIKDSIRGLKKYQYKWVKRYINHLSETNEMDSFEELVNITKEFEKNKNNLQNKEISTYNTISEIRNAIEAPSNRSKKRRGRILLKEEYEVVHKDDVLTIYFPHSEKASCEIANRMGFGSVVWCTASEKSANYFESYTFNHNINLYYILTNDDKYNHLNKISISFKRGDENFPIYNGNSTTVDSRNTSLSRESFSNTFGEEYWKDIENKLIEFNKNIKVHPCANYTKNDQYKYVYTDDEEFIEEFIESVNIDNFIDNTSSKLLSLSKNINLTNDLLIKFSNKLSKLAENVKAEERHFLNTLKNILYNIIGKVSFKDIEENIPNFISICNDWSILRAIYSKVNNFNDFEKVINMIPEENKGKIEHYYSNIFSRINLNEEFEKEVVKYIQDIKAEDIKEKEKSKYLSDFLLMNPSITHSGAKLIVEHFKNADQKSYIFALECLTCDIPGHKELINEFIENENEFELQVITLSYKELYRLDKNKINNIIDKFMENKKIINNITTYYANAMKTTHRNDINISKEKIKSIISNDLYKNDFEILKNLISSSHDEEIALDIINISNEHAKLFINDSYYLDKNLLNKILFENNNETTFEMQKEFIKSFYNRIRNRYSYYYNDKLSEMIESVFKKEGGILDQILKDKEFCEYLAKKQTSPNFQIMLAESNFLDAKKSMVKDGSPSVQGIISLLKNNSDYSIVNSCINKAQGHSSVRMGINGDIELQIKLSKDKRASMLKKIAGLISNEIAQVNIVKTKLLPAILELASNATLTEEAQKEIIKVYKETKNDELLQALISNKALTENSIKLLSNEDPVKTKIAVINECSNIYDQTQFRNKMPISIQVDYANDENEEVKLALCNIINRLDNSAIEILALNENEKVRHSAFNKIDLGKISKTIFIKMINEDRRVRLKVFEKISDSYSYRERYSNEIIMKNEIQKMFNDISDIEKLELLRIINKRSNYNFNNCKNSLFILLIENNNINKIFLKSSSPEIREEFAKLISSYHKANYFTNLKLDKESIEIIKNEKDQYVKEAFGKIIDSVAIA